MNQLSFYPARLDDPDTSHAAAALPRTTLRHRVEDALRAHPAGLTDWELTQVLELPDRRKPSVAKRRQEVAAVDTGLRRRSPDGNDCIVWRLP